MTPAALALSPARRSRRPKTDRTRAVAYIRASTGRQTLTLDAQREALERFALQGNLQIVEVVVDQISGAAPLAKRVGLWRAIELAKEHGAGALLVVRRDRLARDSLTAELLTRDLAAAGIEVVAVDGGNGDSPQDRMVRKILDSVAEFERELIAARTTAAIRSKKSRGLKSNGTAPFGFRIEGDSVVVDETEQATIRRILELKSEGKSVTAIVQALDAEQHPSRGARWHRTTVHRILAAHPVET